MPSFLEQALVFIGSAVLLVPLFQRLRLGSVLGYLMAGVVVGPQCFGLIQDSGNVLHIAELGVALLLFLIGLEIQPRKLWSMRMALIGLGGMQVLATTFIFTGIGLACDLSFFPALILGLGLSLSSTAFAMQTLAERNELNTQFGRSSFSILLMQDLVAIPALALIPIFGGASGGSAVSITKSFIAVLIVIAVLVGSRFLIGPAFRLIARTRSREIFTAATLFVVLGVAALMQRAGLSAALGTFVAGVLLSDSEFRHELEANLEPFKSLLMGLFFIGIGLEVDVSLILSQPFLVLGLAVAYVMIKALVIYGIGRLFKLKHESSKQMALTISQGGEFAFVIFTMALQYQLARSGFLSLLTVVISVSMAVSPLMHMAVDALSRLKKEVGIEPEYDEMKDEAPQVIIAGFGRFGQIFGRLLRTLDIPFIAIDHDSDQIELVRKFGGIVYYGDASREDLLEAAGASRAKYLVLAIDDVELSLKTAKIVKDTFPNLKIFARARNRGHAFDLMELGIDFIKRETIDSSVNFVGELLIEMGQPAAQVHMMLERFRSHDEIMMKEQFKVRKDDKMYISILNQGNAQLAQVLNDESVRTYIEPQASVVNSNEALVSANE